MVSDMNVAFHPETFSFEDENGDVEVEGQDHPSNVSSSLPIVI